MLLPLRSGLRSELVREVFVVRRLGAAYQSPGERSDAVACREYATDSIDGAPAEESARLRREEHSRNRRRRDTDFRLQNVFGHVVERHSAPSS